MIIWKERVELKKEDKKGSKKWKFCKNNKNNSSKKPKRKNMWSEITLQKPWKKGIKIYTHFYMEKLIKIRNRVKVWDF